MKTKMVILSIAFLIAYSSASTAVNSFGRALQLNSKKQDGGFAFLRTHRQAKGITLTWGVVTGNDVIGFTVQRTDQDPTDPYSFWEDIYSTSGDNSRSYKYTDNTVFPGVINYRVVATLADGSSIVSEISAVRIVSHK